MIYVRNSSNVPKLITDVRVRNLSNVSKPISFIKIRDANNVLRTVWQRLTVTGGSYVDGYGNSNSPVTITTAGTALSVSGGVAPFTYSWTGTAGWTILYPSQLNTAFRRGSVANGASYSGTFTLTATDANGNTAQYSVGAYVENLGGFS